MNKNNLKVTLAILGFVAFMAILGWAGDIDYTEQVILHMTAEQYDSVRDQLIRQNGGAIPSQRDIAHWWAAHHND